MQVNAKFADAAEQLLAIIFYFFFCERFFLAIMAGATDPRVVAVLIAVGTVLLLLLLRRSTLNISLRLDDWVWALLGTLVGLTITPVITPLAPGTGLGLVLGGTAVAIVAKLSLWRSFGLVPANRGIRTGGLYRFVRHPMYAAYLVVHIGTLLLLPNLWNLGVYAIVWGAMAMRIRAEERLLATDPDYVEYSARTRWRLIPGVV
jgi:protein-S-isoprenylcysteine O-methyltransferase Ste14